MIDFMLIRDSCILLLYTFTSLFALIGNGLVCRICFLRKHPTNLPLSTTSIFLLNLAIADALTGLTIPFQFILCSKYFLENLTLSPYLCISNKSIQILAYNASTLTMCVIAIDRYRLIQNPLRQYSRRNARQRILFTWIVSALFAGTCLISMKVHTYFISNQKLISCQVLFPVKNQYISSGSIRKIRIVFHTVLFYIIPLLLTSTLCVLTMRTIARRSIIGVQQFQKFKQSRTRSIRLLNIIVIVFALSHFPVHFVHIQDFFISSSNRRLQIYKCNDTTMYLLFYWLGISNCCHNPIIYSWFNRQFRSMVFCGRR